MLICKKYEDGGGVEGEVVYTVTLHWLMYNDRLSAVRGEHCMLGRSADVGADSQ